MMDVALAEDRLQAFRLPVAPGQSVDLACCDQPAAFEKYLDVLNIDAAAADQQRVANGAEGHAVAACLLFAPDTRSIAQELSPAAVGSLPQELRAGRQRLQDILESAIAAAGGEATQRGAALAACRGRAPLIVSNNVAVQVHKLQQQQDPAVPRLLKVQHVYAPDLSSVEVSAAVAQAAFAHGAESAYSSEAARIFRMQHALLEPEAVHWRLLLEYSSLRPAYLDAARFLDALCDTQGFDWTAGKVPCATTAAALVANPRSVRHVVRAADSTAARMAESRRTDTYAKALDSGMQRVRQQGTFDAQLVELLRGDAELGRIVAKSLSSEVSSRWLSHGSATTCCDLTAKLLVILDPAIDRIVKINLLAVASELVLQRLMHLSTPSTGRVRELAVQLAVVHGAMQELRNIEADIDAAFAPFLPPEVIKQHDACAAEKPLFVYHAWKLYEKVRDFAKDMSALRLGLASSLALYLLAGDEREQRRFGFSIWAAVAGLKPSGDPLKRWRKLAGTHTNERGCQAVAALHTLWYITYGLYKTKTLDPEAAAALQRDPRLTTARQSAVDALAALNVPLPPSLEDAGPLEEMKAKKLLRGIRQWETPAEMAAAKGKAPEAPAAAAASGGLPPAAVATGAHASGGRATTKPSSAPPAGALPQAAQPGSPPPAPSAAQELRDGRRPGRGRAAADVVPRSAHPGGISHGRQGADAQQLSHASPPAPLAPGDQRADAQQHRQRPPRGAQRLESLKGMDDGQARTSGNNGRRVVRISRSGAAAGGAARPHGTAVGIAAGAAGLTAAAGPSCGQPARQPSGVRSPTAVPQGTPAPDAPRAAASPRITSGAGGCGDGHVSNAEQQQQQQQQQQRQPPQLGHAADTAALLQRMRQLEGSNTALRAEVAAERAESAALHARVHALEAELAALKQSQPPQQAQHSAPAAGGGVWQRSLQPPAAAPQAAGGSPTAAHQVGFLPASRLLTTRSSAGVGAHRTAAAPAAPADGTGAVAAPTSPSPAAQPAALGAAPAGIAAGVDDNNGGAAGTQSTVPAPAATAGAASGNMRRAQRAFADIGNTRHAAEQRQSIGLASSPGLLPPAKRSKHEGGEDASMDEDA